MKKTKADVEETRMQILDAAFDCFYDNGFKPTSLDMIASSIGMTRGAIYWHFKDKTELFKAVFLDTIQKADIADYALSLDDSLSYREKLYQVFDFANTHNRHVNFIYKSTNIIQTNPEFIELAKDIQLLKMKLYRFFADETRFAIRKYNIETLDSGYYAATLFFLFEGMFLARNIKLDVSTDKDHTHQYIDIVISDLIRTAHGKELARLRSDKEKE